MADGSAANTILVGRQHEVQEGGLLIRQSRVLGLCTVSSLCALKTSTGTRQLTLMLALRQLKGCQDSLQLPYDG